MYNKVLVPTDGSKNALAAVGIAVDLLQGGICKSVSLIPVSYTHLTLPTNREV